MNPILRNSGAFVVAFIVGSCVNMGLIIAGPHIIPPPPGVNVMEAESLAANMHLFEPKHFVFPFLAHAMGALVGALVAALLAASHQMKLALGIGVLFLAGGVMAAQMIPAPTWFIALDLIAAYLPMGWLGGVLAAKIRG